MKIKLRASEYSVSPSINKDVVLIHICYKALKTNIQLNPNLAPKISAYPIAISDQKNEVILFARTSYGNSSSSILTRKRDKENSCKGTTLPLLEFIKTEKIAHLDFAKIDIKGAEFKILPDIGAALEKVKYPALYVSFHYKFLNKLFLNIENRTNFSIFKRRLKIENLFDAVLAYKYIYTCKGELIDRNTLSKNRILIKDQDLVFTNTKWAKHKTP